MCRAGQKVGLIGRSNLGRSSTKKQIPIKRSYYEVDMQAFPQGLSAQSSRKEDYNVVFLSTSRLLTLRRNIWRLVKNLENLIGNESRDTTK